MSEAVGSSEGDGEEAGAISAEGGVWGAAGSAICEANPIPNELVERCLANAEERALQEWNYDARHGLSKKQIVALREPSIVLKEAQDSSKLERHACALRGNAGGSVNTDSDGNTVVEVHGGAGGKSDSGKTYEGYVEAEGKRDRGGHVSGKVGIGFEVDF